MIQDRDALCDLSACVRACVRACAFPGAFMGAKRLLQSTIAIIWQVFEGLFDKVV